jgi:2-oxoglutarate ferredoxin oxidoreductase subunit alpha
MDEAAELLAADGVHLDRLRLRGFPFSREVTDFIAEHERIFLVEQNRDAQLRTLMLAECGVDPAMLTPILHYDGTPITARFIREAIGGAVKAVPVAVRQRARS